MKKGEHSTAEGMAELLGYRVTLTLLLLICSNIYNLHFMARDPVMLKAMQSQNQDHPCSQMLTTYAKREHTRTDRRGS